MTAFNAKLRLLENTKREKENSPTHILPIDFTIEEARKAAGYLLDAADKAEKERTTVRIYKGQNDFQEVAGFTSWASLWERNGSLSGSWSPILKKDTPKQANQPETDLF